MPFNNISMPKEQVAIALAEKINEIGHSCNPHELKIDGKKHRLGKNAHIEYIGYPDSGVAWCKNFKTDEFLKVFSRSSISKRGEK